MEASSATDHHDMEDERLVAQHRSMFKPLHLEHLDLALVLTLERHSLPDLGVRERAIRYGAVAAPVLAVDDGLRRRACLIPDTSFDQQASGIVGRDLVAKPIG